MVKNRLRVVCIARYLLCWGCHATNIVGASSGCYKGLAWLWGGRVSEHFVQANAPAMCQIVAGMLEARGRDDDRQWLASIGVHENAAHVSHNMCELSKVLGGHGRRRYVPVQHPPYDQLFANVRQQLCAMGQLEKQLEQHRAAQPTDEEALEDDDNAFAVEQPGGVAEAEPCLSARLQPSRKALDVTTRCVAAARGTSPDGRGGHAGRKRAAALVLASPCKKTCISADAFQRCVRDCAREIAPSIRFEPETLVALQVAAEEIISSVLGDSAECMRHRGLRTLKRRDLRLAVDLRRKGGEQIFA